MATTITLKRARKILGKLADNVSDEELEKDIKAAELLKTLFFSRHLRSTDKQTQVKS